MDRYCTCGAALPEGARFCHRCGRPLTAEAEAEEARLAAPPAAPLPPPPAPSPVSFRNSGAVKVAGFAAVATCALFLIPLPGVAAIIWQFILPLAGGFFAVYLYRRRTGSPLTVASGARIGWLTGIFCFVIVAVLFTLVVAILSTPGLREAVLESAGSDPARKQMMEQFQEIISTPAGILVPLVFFFFLLTGLPAVGGAVAAAVLARD